MHGVDKFGRHIDHAHEPISWRTPAFADEYHPQSAGALADFSRRRRATPELPPTPWSLLPDCYCRNSLPVKFLLLQLRRTLLHPGVHLQILLVAVTSGTRSPESVSVRGLLTSKSHPRSHFRSGLRLRAKSCPGKPSTVQVPGVR